MTGSSEKLYLESWARLTLSLANLDALTAPRQSLIILRLVDRWRDWWRKSICAGGSLRGRPETSAQKQTAEDYFNNGCCEMGLRLTGCGTLHERL